jgi:hypothetical protein
MLPRYPFIGRLVVRTTRAQRSALGLTCLAFVAACSSNGPTGVPPDYSLSLSLAALEIIQGSSQTATVSITRTAFTGAVTLSLAGAPAGVTGSFDPAAPTGTGATLTIDVGASVAPGAYDLKVAGTGTPGNKSADLKLTVMPLPDYAISISPTALTVNKGSNGNATLTLTRTNFTDAVTLSLSGAPSGVTGTFNPPAPTGTSAALTVNVDGTVTPGVYDLTVDGTGAPGDRSTPLTLTVGEAPDYALSLSSPDLSIERGASGNTSVTIARTNFSEAVTLSLGGAPAGVTGTFNPAAPTGDASTLTVSVGGAVAPGVYNLTVDGSATAADHSTPLTLTVTAPANYALSLSPSSLGIDQGTSQDVTVTIDRTNFTGDVTLSLGGAPGGVTGSFNPATTTGTSSKLTITVDGAVAPGQYNLTVDGTASLGNRSAPLTLAVVVPGSTNATVDFSLCTVPNQPVWFAYQDGNGPWIAVTGAGGVFQFNITAAGGGGYAYVLDQGTSVTTSVHWETLTRLTNAPIVVCPTATTTKTISGTAVGLTGFEITSVSLGGAIAHPNYGSPDFQLTVPTGTYDLVAYRRGTGGLNDTAIIRRDQDIPNLGSLAPVDFAGSEAFAPATAQLTVSGLLGETNFTETMRYVTRGACTLASPLYDSFDTPPTTISGIPSGKQRADDFHWLSFVTFDDFDHLRFANLYFHTLADQAITLGPAAPDPTITALPGSYDRLQAEFTRATEYKARVVFTYLDPSSKTAFITASDGYLGGLATTLAMPDFSGLAGWQNAWAPKAGTGQGQWSLQESSTAPCVDGNSVVSAYVRGSY